jgi:alpha-glucoside transport system substrate-binding protein
MGGPYSEGEGMYPESFAGFEKKTGIDIQYRGYQDFDTVLMTLVAAGDAPDIANINHPVLLTNLVRDVRIVDVNKFMDLDALRENYNSCWLDMATREAPGGNIMAGVWHRYNTKGLVWYPKEKFEEFGYSIPQTWQDMLKLSDQIVSDGGTPWCIGIESGENTGWVATDWIEEIILRTTSLKNYDQWANGDLPFSSFEVRRAFEIMSDIWFRGDYVYGGRDAIVKTNYYNAAQPMFDDPPGCWLHKQSSIITGSFPEGAQFGVDYDVFTLPPIDEQYGKVFNVYGDIMVMFNDRPEVRAVMEFLTTGESTRAWLDIGGQLSPHNDTNLSRYRNDVDRRIAELAQDADCFRYDGSYLMVSEVGMDAFFKYITAYISGEISLETALYEIDNSWP